MALLALTLLLLNACSNVPVSREAQRVRVQEGFGRKFVGDVTEEYYVAPRDAVALQSLNYEELNLTQQVGPDGRITIPLIGQFQVAGLTPSDIENTLSELLGQYMKKVDLVVLVDLRASKRVFVTSTKRGTTVPFTGDMTVFDVVVRSTFQQFADLKNIRIIRADPVQPEVFKFNFRRMRSHGDSSSNVQLKEDDIVFVPLTTFGKFVEALDLALTPIKVIGSAANTILRGWLIPAQFAGVDEVAERIEEGRVRGEVRGQNGSIFF